MKKHIIYKRTFPNGKVYIGQTSQNIQNYTKQIFLNAFNEKLNIHKTFLGKAIRKYKDKGIGVQILYSNIDSDCIDDLETLMISTYDSTNSEKGYNICKIGGSRSGVKASQQTKQKNKTNGLRDQNIQMLRKLSKDKEKYIPKDSFNGEIFKQNKPIFFKNPKNQYQKNCNILYYRQYKKQYLYKGIKKGQKHSQQTKIKMSIKRTGVKSPRKGIINQIAKYAYDQNGTMRQVYPKNFRYKNNHKTSNWHYLCTSLYFQLINNGKKL